MAYSCLLFYSNGLLNQNTQGILEGGDPLDTLWTGTGLRFAIHLPFPLLDSRDQMDDTKFFEKIGPFGILALFFAFFLSFTLCTCLIVHVRFIWTYLCPLKGVRDCCRSFSRKFSSSHKKVPQTIHELEELVSSTQRAKKIDRKVNQADSLREFAKITPRINNFVIELRQERIFRGGV